MHTHVHITTHMRAHMHTMGKRRLEGRGRLGETSKHKTQYGTPNDRIWPPKRRVSSEKHHGICGLAVLTWGKGSEGQWKKWESAAKWVNQLMVHNTAVHWILLSNCGIIGFRWSTMYPIVSFPGHGRLWVNCGCDLCLSLFSCCHDKII